MRPVIWSVTAQRNLAEIYRYLEQLNPDAAVRLALDVLEATGILSDHPHAGRASRGRRELISGRCVIVYRVNAGDVRILRVWHGGQDRGR